METLTEIFSRATELIDSLTALVTDSPITYLLIFGLAAFDVLFPILPSEATVTAAAVLAGTGQLTLGWVLLAAGLGAFVGDNIAYWVGRLAGRPLVTRILRGDTKKLDGIQEQFRLRGGLFIIVGRFIPGGRTAVAIGAGVLHYRWARFIVYDALAATIWAVQVSLPGYIGGVVVQDRPWLALVIGFGLSMVIAASVALGQRWWDRRRRHPDVRSEEEAGRELEASRPAGLAGANQEEPARTAWDDAVPAGTGSEAAELEAGELEAGEADANDRHEREPGGSEEGAKRGQRDERRPDDAARGADGDDPGTRRRSAETSADAGLSRDVAGCGRLPGWARRDVMPRRS